MLLTELISGNGSVRLSRDAEVAGIAADSRDVRPGYLFAALAGTKTDGNKFINDALDRGAIAVLAQPGVALPRDAALVEDANPRRRLALMAARFFEVQPAHIAAVTGTNGKTSVANFIAQIFEHQGMASGSVGTLGVRSKSYSSPLGHTTPDPVMLHRMLAELKRHGVDHVGLEASSHGLDQFRLDGVRISAAGFTNLTRDHMDYHGGMNAYFAAKMRLFEAVMPSGRIAVINADSDWSCRVADVCRARRHQIMTYGQQGHDLKLRSLTPHESGLALDVDLWGIHQQIELPLMGAFQAGNALCALALSVAIGADRDKAISALHQLEGVPGRMQLVGRKSNGGAVFVDYAHSPDAIENVLLAARPHATGRLIVVFGCGGDRDRGKRPMMGRMASEKADIVIVTDDNPRSEEPAAIRAEVMKEAKGALEIGDRRAAISAGIDALRNGDVLVIAGKGHEQGQIIGDVTHPFDDASIAREFLSLAPSSASTPASRSYSGKY